MPYPKHVSIIEVGPRDGLQNEATSIHVDDKLTLIHDLVAAGCRRIEVGSFVSAKWVPQMADSAALVSQLTHSPKHPNVIYSALTPNLRGLEDAIASGIDEVAVFGAASEGFSQKNINCSIAESIARFTPVIALAKQHNIPVRGYVSTVLGCPYEGDVPLENVLYVARELYRLGCYEISLGDTIGVGTPLQTQRMLETLLLHIPVKHLAVHFHNTYGQALANVLIALQLGITNIDSAVAGLGGCPYATGASGNLATEDLVYMLHGMGISTGIDLPKLIHAGQQITNTLNITPASNVNRALC